MVVGFNHNFRYNGEIYHIQTEDSGIKSPNIVTLLYQGGTILASKKTSYADITRIDNLEQVVEELMKEQHKNMLRSLKAGEFDAVIDKFLSTRSAARRAPQEGAAGVPAGDVKPVAEESSSVPVAAAPVAPATAPKAQSAIVAEAPRFKATNEKAPSSTAETSLDEVILSYLMGDDK